MAKKSMINKNNIEGDFFVDTRCIGCNTCTRIAPSTFMLKDSLSYVKKQPQGDEEIYKASLALLSCPVFSIGTNENKEKLREIKKNLPLLIENDIYFNSCNSFKSYGANSYFIKREKGNILVDSPRFDKQLVKNLEKLGGIAYIYLTHIDDIADYKKFQKHFAARVIFHEDDFNEKISTADIILKSNDIYTLDEDIIIIPQSGHTKGHTVLLYKNHYLFSGDNLAYNPQDKHLYAFKDYCWYDWETQLKSLKVLLNFNFSHLLPGHGKGIKTTKDNMKKMLYECIKYNKIT